MFMRVQYIERVLQINDSDINTIRVTISKGFILKLHTCNLDWSFVILLDLITKLINKRFYRYKDSTKMIMIYDWCTIVLLRNGCKVFYIVGAMNFYCYYGLFGNVIRAKVINSLNNQWTYENRCAFVATGFQHIFLFNI